LLDVNGYGLSSVSLKIEGKLGDNGAKYGRHYLPIEVFADVYLIFKDYLCLQLQD
jgi:hypothetical protein